MNVMEAMQWHSDREKAMRENSARPATQYLTYESTGAGQLVLPTLQRFDTPFIGEPIVVSGFAVKRPPNARLFGMPRVSAGVYRWEIERDRHFHIGAYLYFAVDCPYTAAGQEALELGTLDEAPEPIVVHHLQFSSMSYKVLPGMADIGDTLPTHTMPMVP